MVTREEARDLTGRKEKTNFRKLIWTVRMIQRFKNMFGFEKVRTSSDLIPVPQTCILLECAL